MYNTSCICTLLFAMCTGSDPLSCSWYRVLWQKSTKQKLSDKIMKTILVTYQKQTIFKCLKKRNTSKIFVLNKTLIR